jgi:hypothetical protein
VNDANLYAVLVYLPTITLRLDIAVIFREELFKTLIADGIDEAGVQKLLGGYQPAIYTKSTSRSILGTINDLRQNVIGMIDARRERGEPVDIDDIRQLINRIPKRNIEWKYAVEAMRIAIQE